jgi:hypothetical protein
MPSKGAAGIAGIAVATLLAFVPSAVALETVSVKGVDQGDGLFIGTATCPAGKTVVSGGFEVNPTGTATVNKAKGERRWVVQATDSTSLTVTANCSKRLDPSVSSRARAFGANNEGVNTTTKARCKRGQVVAGGWAFQPAGDSLSNSPVFKSNRKGTDRWVVTAVHDDPNAQSKIKVFAYCLRGVGVRARGDSVEIEPNADEMATAACKPGEELLGGGYTTTPRPDWNNMTGPDNFYFASQRSGPREWQAGARNHSSVDGEIVTTAICRT